MALAGAQDDLQGVVIAGGEEGFVVSAVREGADAQEELRPVGNAGGGENSLTPGQQGSAVGEDEGAGVVVGSGGLEEGQQGVPDPELHSLVLGAVAVGQDMEAEHARRRGGPGRSKRQQGEEQTGGDQQDDHTFHGNSIAKGKAE